MRSSVANLATTSEAKTLVTSCHRGARENLQAVVDTSGIPRKALAADVCDGDEPLFSKKLAGTPGRPFDLDDLDRLPRAVRVAWLQRMCAAAGLTVPRELDLPELTEQLLAHIDEVATLAKLARVVGKAGTVKAGGR